jgi:putative hydrolase of the HAD superfamily
MLDNTLSPASAPIRAVIFDWGGVIEELPDDARFAEWEARLGLPAGDLREILWGSVWAQVETGAIERAAYEAHICARCGFPGPEALPDFYKAFYPSRAFPEMLAAVAALRRRYQVALLTNADLHQPRHITRMVGMPPTELVDHYVNSAEVGVRKPDPAIFHLVLGRLGVAPAEAIFIDDYHTNIEAAIQLGIPAIHFETPAQALTALAARLGHPIEDYSPTTDGM